MLLVQLLLKPPSRKYTNLFIIRCLGHSTYFLYQKFISFTIKNILNNKDVWLFFMISSNKSYLLSDPGCMLKTLYQLYYLLTQKPQSKYQLYNLQLLIMKKIFPRVTELYPSQEHVSEFLFCLDFETFK